MITVPCKGCGAPMVWVTTPDGRRVPLDPRPSIYRVAPIAGSMVAYLVTGKEDPLPNDGGKYMVSHFATCPAAARLGGRTRRKTTAP